ncbi:PREDICTED: MATH domain and coiled-coil domain-containing protein At2g42480-like [Camelina sativa]|uniref:MATH domain and coiled-coil domain-containing protein At2g42480-like n=1 Tax=Camelina sativa TaxID=90675 RepID=A0ABM1RPS4_CAMSA|nr:PREDICTED: MATH domain and coiled-coil domain-containing protein At2g42480-like [Camelina sativa]
MGKNQVQRNSSFRFEIDNFSEKEAVIASQIFVSHGCEWYLSVYPKGDSLCGDHLPLFLYVANPKSLGKEWKRKANFRFVLLNQSDKELYRSPIGQGLYSAKFTGKGFRNTFPLKKLQEKGFLENDRLIVEVYISRVEIVDGEGRVESENKETLDINGFQVFASRATSARKIFTEHPDIAEDFKPKNQVVKTEYMNVLLNLIETLNKPSQNHSESELSNAQSELSELMEQGFKLDWLKSKLDEVSLRRKKSDADHVQQLDERVKNLELMNLDFKLDCLKTKLDEVSLERKKLDDADGSRVKEMVARIKNLEMVVSDLRVKLDKDEGKSFADDFVLIEQVDWTENKKFY